MILPIYVYGQPVLREEAKDITPDYPELKELIQNMFETMDRNSAFRAPVILNGTTATATVPTNNSLEVRHSTIMTR